MPHKAKDRYRARDRQRDDDRHHHRQQDQDIVITIDRRPEDDRSDLREAFGAAARKRAGKADAEKSGTGAGQGAGKGESARDGRGGDGGDGAVRRRQRTRRQDRAHEIEIPEDQGPVFGAPPPDVPEPHWTELPLADKFHDAARDRDEAGSESESGGRRIRPSRSARGNDRGDDDRDFERER